MRGQRAEGTEEVVLAARIGSGRILGFSFLALTSMLVAVGKRSSRRTRRELKRSAVCHFFGRPALSG